MNHDRHTVHRLATVHCGGHGGRSSSVELEWCVNDADIQMFACFRRLSSDRQFRSEPVGQYEQHDLIGHHRIYVLVNP